MKILHLNGFPLYALRTSVNLQEKRVYLSEQGKSLGKIPLRFYDSKTGHYSDGDNYYQWLDVQDHIIKIIGDFAYRPGPDGYAQYYHKRKGWVSSATVPNSNLE